MVSPNSEIRISHYFIKVLHIKHFIQKKKKNASESFRKTGQRTRQNIMMKKKEKIFGNNNSLKHFKCFISAVKI